MILGFTFFYFKTTKETRYSQGWTDWHRQKSETMEFVFGAMLMVKKRKKTITEQP